MLKFKHNISNNKLPGVMKGVLELCVTKEYDENLPCAETIRRATHDMSDAQVICQSHSVLSNMKS